MFLMQGPWSQGSQCFNPCFRGTCSWCYHLCRGGEASGVSILVFVELALDGRVLRPEPQRHGVFQSLFSWNLLLMCGCASCLIPGPLGFNPCFRGTCSWWLIEPLSTFADCGVSILVFVELALDGLVRSMKRPHGTAVSILVFVELALDAMSFGFACWYEQMFQSLFSWNLLLMPRLGHWVASMHWVSILVFVELALDVIQARAVFVDDEFQSLFSWNLLLMSSTGKSTSWPGWLFQSLFSWNLLLMDFAMTSCSSASIVSILVFVELALDVNDPGYRTTSVKFQSLFSWNLLLMSIDFWDEVRLGEFQSLFSWNLLLM